MTQLSVNQAAPYKAGPKRRRLNIPSAWVTPLGVIGAVIAAFWVVVAFTAPLWVPYDPLAQTLPRLQPPGIDTLMGTDALGRDVFSRLMTLSLIHI